MSSRTIQVVTGALGYSGRYIARRLIERGIKVRTLTNSRGNPNPFGKELEVHPLRFDDDRALCSSLEGAEVLYNTYWIRFNHGRFSRRQAVTNSLKLFEAARRAGVKKFVHVSITNPSEESGLEYFQGKAVLERRLMESGMDYVILRPTVLFGREDILVNNIAWTLRRFPFIGLFGDGSYRLQPLFVDDLAELAVVASETKSREVIEAIGPETFTFKELVECIGEAIGRPRPILNFPPRLAYWATKVIGAYTRDVMLTWDEVQGLMQGRLWVDAPPAGTTKLSDWAKAHSDSLGMRYANELARRNQG